MIATLSWARARKSAGGFMCQRRLKSAVSLNQWAGHRSLLRTIFFHSIRIGELPADRLS